MIAPLTKKWSECPASESGSGDLFCPAYSISIAYAFRIVNTKIRCFRDEFSRSYSSPNCNFRSSHFKFCFAKEACKCPNHFLTQRNSECFTAERTFFLHIFFLPQHHDRAGFLARRSKQISAPGAGILTEKPPPVFHRDPRCSQKDSSPRR